MTQLRVPDGCAAQSPHHTRVLFSLNDVELFDLEKDPSEVENLALDRRGHSALLEEMNAKLNRLIDTEVGQGVGQMMPPRVDGGWVAIDATKDV
jgi:hypothetical protein